MNNYDDEFVIIVALVAIIVCLLGLISYLAYDNEKLETQVQTLQKCQPAKIIWR